MISKDELLMGRDHQYPNDYTQEISDNLDRLLIPMNIVRTRYAKPMYVASGWRPPSINEHTSNAATKSNHLKGLAVDIKDPDGSLRQWVIDHIEWLAGLGFYFEDFKWTPGWVHFQIVPPKSHNRIYVPSTAPAKDPNAWSGQYDHTLDY